MERRNLRWGLLFISPWLFGFLVLGVFPILYTFYLSLTRYSGLRDPIFIGVANYQRMAADPQFWKATYNTLYYTLLAVPIGAAVAMGLALIMNQRLREVAVYRAIYYLPSILPVFAISFIFVVFLNPGYGLLNHALTSIGLQISQLAGGSGLHQARPGDDRPARRRSVRVDLPGRSQGDPGRALRIRLDRRGRPLPQILQHHAAADDAGDPLRLDHRAIAGLQVFTPAFILTGGGERAAGPDNSLLTFVFFIYRQAFQFGQMGYAATASVVLFITSLILAIVVFRWARSWVYYEAVR